MMKLMKMMRLKWMLHEPPSKVKNFKEAIEALEDVNHFLENHGHIEASSMVGSAIDEIATLKSSAYTKQTTICKFFQKKN